MCTHHAIVDLNEGKYLDWKTIDFFVVYKKLKYQVFYQTLFCVHESFMLCLLQYAV